MALMIFIMMLPLIGLGLFYIWPLSAALPTYLVLVAFSAFFHVLMMKGRRRSMTTGPEALLGRPVVVLSWKDRSGQVWVHGEIWEARTQDETSVKKDDVLYVVEVQGLMLIVASRSGDRLNVDSSPDAANAAGEKETTGASMGP